MRRCAGWRRASPAWKRAWSTVPPAARRRSFDGHVVGDLCAFCASPLLVEQAHVERLIQPQALLPFALDRRPRSRSSRAGWAAAGSRRMR
jgi:hypothetical protein